MDIFRWQNVEQLSNHVELMLDVKSFKDLNRKVVGKWHRVEQDLGIPFVVELDWGDLKNIDKASVSVFNEEGPSLGSHCYRISGPYIIYTCDLATGTVTQALKHYTLSPQFKFTHGRDTTDTQIEATCTRLCSKNNTAKMC